MSTKQHNSLEHFQVLESPAFNLDANANLLSTGLKPCQSDRKLHFFPAFFSVKTV